MTHPAKPGRRSAALWTLLIAIAATAPGRPAHASPWHEAAQAASDAFRPLDDADLAVTRDRLGPAIVAAERALGAPSPAAFEWMDYLAWSGAQSLLSPNGGDADAARETLRRLTSGAAGLERSEFGRVRSALADYLAVERIARFRPELQSRAVNAAAERLAAVLEDPDQLDSPRASYDAEQRLDLLSGAAAAGLDGGILDRVSRAVSQPNAVVLVERSLLGRAATRPVSDTSPITDCILGVAVRGTGTTHARLSVSPLAASHAARLALTLSGQVSSRTVGTKGPARLDNVGTTPFTVTKVVELSENAWRMLPANATASTRTRTVNASKIGGGIGSRLVRSIALKRAAEQRPQADAIASQRAESRLAARFDQRVNEQLANARRRYDQRVTWPLRRRGADPRRLSFHSTSESVVVEATLADATQFAAASPPPEAGPASPLRVALHQSALNNLLDATLGGATLSQSAPDAPVQADVVLPDWLDTDEPLKPNPDFRPWTLTLRDRRPVSVGFADDEAVITVHLAELSTEENTYRDWDVTARYRLAADDGWRLVRVGELEVLPSRFDPESGKQLKKAEVGLRNNLRRALSTPPDRIAQEIALAEIKLPPGDGSLRRLVAEGYRFSGGWALAGFSAE